MSNEAKPEVEIETKKDYYAPAGDEHDEGVIESGTLTVINTAEINQQIATAHRFPRSLTSFRRRVYEMVTIDTETAESCIYAVPRDGKMIDGPSIRFAEILLVGWGNHRSAAEVTSVDEEYVVAEGVFFDLETNGAIKAKIMRRIVGRPSAQFPKGKRYSVDGIANTGNAACSIALRNAVLRGVPKALWKDLWEEAKKVAGGTAQTFVTRRDKVMKELGIQGATPEMIFALLGIKGADDMQTEHLVHLRGLQNAIKDGETSLEDAFTVRGGEGRPGEAVPPRPQKSEFERKSPEAPKPQQEVQTSQQQQTPTEPKPAAKPEPVVETATPAPSDAFEDWYKDQKAALVMLNSVRDVADLQDEVLPQLSDDADKTSEFKELCNTRNKEIMAAGKKARGK